MDEVAKIVEPSVETRSDSDALINKVVFPGLLQLAPNPVSEVHSQGKVSVFESFADSSGTSVALVFRSVQVKYPLQVGDK